MSKPKIFLYYTRSGRKRYALWRGLTLLGTSTKRTTLQKKLRELKKGKR